MYSATLPSVFGLRYSVFGARCFTAEYRRPNTEHRLRSFHPDPVRVQLAIEVRALDTEGITTFVIPGGQLAVIVGLASFAGVLAALGPARRASRLNVLSAIATS